MEGAKSVAPKFLEDSFKSFALWSKVHGPAGEVKSSGEEKKTVQIVGWPFNTLSGEGVKEKNKVDHKGERGGHCSRGRMI